MVRFTKFGLMVAAALAIGTSPIAAQNYSDSYSFLKAVKERKGEDVDRLLARPNGAVLNAKDGSGEGALHILARGRDLTWMSFVLGKGARADIQNKEGLTPLGIAAQLGWIEGAEMLLRFKAAVDLPNNRGETPLIAAVQNRDVAMARLLMRSGANPKRTDSVTGYSALDHARRDPRAAAVLRVLEAPADKPLREVAGPKL